MPVSACTYHPITCMWWDLLFPLSLNVKLRHLSSLHIAPFNLSTDTRSVISVQCKLRCAERLQVLMLNPESVCFKITWCSNYYCYTLFRSACVTALRKAVETFNIEYSWNLESCIHSFCYWSALNISNITKYLYYKDITFLNKTELVIFS